VFHYRNQREGLGADMEKDIPMGTHANKQPLEIDIRRILEQLGIQKDKWPEEYGNSVQKSSSTIHN
jgi:hypothetical protein